ncbi:MAG TPA: hypothetical protein VH325_15775 [Bryobacteraceae bacterium]|nr:hypothetical protein [Bryobacteraceae bacterium]
MKNDIHRRARADANRDRVDSYKGSQKSKYLNDEAETAGGCRPDPTQEQTHQQDDAYYALGSPGHTVLESVQQHAKMGQAGSDERGALKQ